MVPMRDGVHICVDMYRPEVSGRFPALLAFAVHNKDLQAPEITDAIPPQPAWSPLWQGSMEAGDTTYLVARGYVHVIGNPRGVGKSEDGGSPEWDLNDLIEWISQQFWCNGQIGMVGISAYAGAQWRAALQHSPHLKAIFPYDAFAAYGEMRDRYPGGVLHVMSYLLDQLGVVHGVKGRPGRLPPEVERLWTEAINNPDYKMYSNLYNLLTMKGQMNPSFFHTLLDLFYKEEVLKKSEENFDQIKIPVYTGSG